MRTAPVLALLLLALIACPGAETTGSELLGNGDFEEWNAMEPVGWSAWGENNATTQVTQAAGAASGVRAVRFGDRDPTKGAVLRHGPVAALAASGMYELTFFARSTVPEQGLTVIAYSDPHAGTHWYRKTDLRLTGEWRRYAVPIRTADAATMRPVFIHFWLAGGAVEIDAASLTEVRAENASPLADRANRLDDPGFDLGGSAWRWFPWYQATAALPSFDERIRHAGRRSIHFPGQGESVESRLYALPAGKTWTLSAWIRGPADGPRNGSGFVMFLITAAWKLQPLEVPAAKVTGEWQRFSLTWQPPPDDDPYGASVYVRFDAHSELWLDSLQLEAGDAPTDYRPGPQIGLACALPDGVAGPGTVPLTLRAERPSAVASTAVVSARDARDRELWSTRLDLGSVGQEGVTVPVDAQLARLGVAELRAELRAELLGTEGPPLAAATLRLAVMDSRTEIAPNPLIGIDNNPIMHLAPRLRERERWASLLGAGCTRIFFDCTNGTRKALEEDGSEFLAIAGELLAPEMQHGRPVTACIQPAHGSSLNLERMRRENRGPDPADEPAAIAAFVRRATTIATAMRGKIGCYEILNEPNIWYIEGQPVMPADRLARIIAGVAPALRAAAPGVRVAANINGIDLPYVEALLSSPAAAQIDLLTVHPYRATPELPPLFEDLRKLRALVERLRPGLPIASTEQYYLSRGDGFANGEYNRNYAAEHETDQAGRTVQAALHFIAAEASPYVFFQPDDNLYRQRPDGVHWFFAATMVRHLSRMLAGTESGTTLDAHPACRAFLYRRPDGTRVVAVMARDYGLRGRLVVPSGCTASDCDGNPATGPEVTIDHLPAWLTFPVGTSDAAIAQALHGADWRGFDFPLLVHAAQSPHGLALAVANRGTKPAGGAVEILAAPAGLPTGRVDIEPIAPGATRQVVLPGTSMPLAWDAEPLVHWRATSGGEVAVRSGRVPTMRIPRISADWPASAWVELGESHLSKDFADGRLPHRGPADLAARVALGWDADGLQFAAEVRDDALFRGTQLDDLLWQVDSLQLYVDPTDSAEEGRRGFGRGNACWMFGEALDGATAALLTHNPGDRYLGAANAETGRDPAVAAIWKRRADGWSLSVRLPARTLPGLRLQGGSRFGWSLLINDNDGAGRKQGLTLGRAGSEPYEQPWLWRCAVLGD